ncbi:hypothetical protein VUR80DRAFT_1259 [Thermomyces stellatus]
MEGIRCEPRPSMCSTSARRAAMRRAHAVSSADSWPAIRLRLMRAKRLGSGTRSGPQKERTGLSISMRSNVDTVLARSCSAAGFALSLLRLLVLFLMDRGRRVAATARRSLVVVLDGAVPGFSDPAGALDAVEGALVRCGCRSPARKAGWGLRVN